MMPHTQISNPTPSSNHISTSFTHFDHISNKNPGDSEVSIVSYSINTKPGFWITDSGVNDRVFSSLHCFSSYYRIRSFNVYLPNRFAVVSKYTYIVNVSPHLCLTNVIYTLNFSLNLLSVLRLCYSINYVFKFF